MKYLMIADHEQMTVALRGVNAAHEMRDIFPPDKINAMVVRESAIWGQRVGEEAVLEALRPEHRPVAENFFAIKKYERDHGEDWP